MVSRALAGRPATTRAAPPSTVWKLRPVSQVTRLLAGPLFCGLMRYPARRSMGSASSAMLGRPERSCSSRVLRSGLRLAVGLGLESRICAIGCGGC
ncbi:hypothetical protein D3C80_1345600 [compost metagenome]